MLSIVYATYAIFGLLACICAVLRYWVSQTPSVASESAGDARFGRFQRRFFVAYFLALFSDWLQGPYVYKLYSSYGFAESEIAQLYVVGFASSAVFGTFAGVLADRLGRRNTSIAFCAIYAICCLTKLSPKFAILMLGRVLGGTATSLLFSTFESWYVYEHVERRRFPSDWLSVTFSRVTFWNGMLAIVAGVLSNVVAETLRFGPVSPFVLAVPVLLSSLVVIARSWDENYGSRRDNFGSTCMDGLKRVLFDGKVLLLGIVQSGFESVMYMFVFVWTPILDSSNTAPLGMIFACFMLCIMIGSIVFQTAISHGVRPDSILKGAIGLAFLSMSACFLATSAAGPPSVPVCYCAFLLLEIAIGVYFPTISCLRSSVIPESHRASIMNWFRLPMNAITCCGLLWLHHENNAHGNHQIFGVCLSLTAAAGLAALGLSAKYGPLLSQKSSLSDKPDSSNDESSEVEMPT